MKVSRPIIENFAGVVSQFWNSKLYLAVMGVLAITTACQREPDITTLKLAFVARKSVEVIAALSPESQVVATLRLGSKVKIVDRRRRFVKVQTKSGLEGWIHRSKLVTSELQELMSQLREQTKHFRTQGRAHAFQALNIHLEPYRWSPTLYQLEPDEGVSILRHQLVERLPHEPQLGSPPPSPTGLDDWYLVRTTGDQPGWVLTTGVYSGIPDEVKQYAERRRITAYLPLGAVTTTSGTIKTTWLWAQSRLAKKPYDFSIVRVFQWNQKARSYRTLRIERNLQGYLPIDFVPEVVTQRGSGPGFSFVVEENSERLRRTYLLLHSRVYLVSQKPAEPPVAEIQLNQTTKKRPEQAKSLRNRLLHQWNKFF